MNQPGPGTLAETNVVPEKNMIGRLVSLWEGLFSGGNC